MKTFIQKNITILAFVAIGILVSNIITYTYAHGGNLNLIHGCVRPITGLLRIVGVNDTCAHNETALDWNIQGVQGPPGSSGSGDLICINCTTRDLLFRLNTSNFLSINMDRANLSGSELNGVDFTGASLVRSILYGIQASGSNFTDANLTNSNMRAGFDHANFTRANLTGADLTYASLEFADMTNANITDVIWNHTYCPDSTNSDDNGGTCIGHL